ncbi:hypothetical protein AMAG_09297 [Allomyces macrogynus ATCC 38327]|uniref:t-SNARE coiled-coil homology domain-containing protein n=1 Tax=Allomyces macrogynus (strain ATCC 38327) TaxID=578462 RepID=A0A0L0SPD7_ALLM3|nr:hypothetical protein AMAG_09297 [Allomyces macrogynus ATCC 38327]|eukprot:KNE64264.1 hypothetical protein AMAG_09297 [Allomyces macrogynus ATCC 38327]
MALAATIQPEPALVSSAAPAGADDVTRARINTDRRLHRLETHLNSLLDDPDKRQWLALNVADLHQVLDKLKTSLPPNDPVLVNYAERLRRLQAAVQHDKASVGLPKFEHQAFRLPNVPHADLLVQLQQQVQRNRDAHEAKRRELLDLPGSAADEPTGSTALKSIPPPTLESLASASAASNASLRQRRPPGRDTRSGTSSSTADQKDVSEALQIHDKVQDELVQNLASMASVLKANARAFSHHLQTDLQVVNDATQILANNTARMDKEADRLKQYRASSRWTTCTLVLVLLVMMGVTAGMYIVIKIF